MILLHPIQLASNPSLDHYMCYPRRQVQCTPTRNLMDNGTKGCSNSSVKDSSPIVLRRMEHQVNDHDGLFTISIEVPGIRLSDMQVSIVKQKIIRVTADRKGTDGKTTLVKYDQSFYVDKRKVKLSEVTATYEDGVLKIKLPKKPVVDARIIEVLTQSPPEFDNEQDEVTNTPFYTSIDLPGVKPNALSVKLHPQNIAIEATRNRGTASFKINRMHPIDPERIDVQSLKAYLMDGVLTIIAPALPTVSAAEASVQDSVVVIPVRKSEVGEELVSATTDETKLAIVNNESNTTAESTDRHSTTVTKDEVAKHNIFDDAVTVETVTEEENDDN